MTLSLSAAPAQAVTIQDYVALGDSYAAGVGGGDYLDACGRSENAYSELADDLKSVWNVTNVACGGATTQDVVGSQLGVLDKKTDLVTITAGGNNLGFANLATLCGTALMYPTTALACLDAIADARAEIASEVLYEDVDYMIDAVRAAAPKADIVLTGYPYLFDPITDPNNPTSFVINQANLLVTELNTAIKAAALANGAEYVDVTDEFAGHGISLPPENDSWIIFGSFTEFENFHPNAEGHEAYFAALYSERVYS